MGVRRRVSRDGGSYNSRSLIVVDGYIMLTLARSLSRAQQSRFVRSMEIVYMTLNGDNLLTFEYIARIRDFEKRLLGNTNYDKFCVLREGSCFGHRSLMDFFPANLTTQEQIDDGVREARQNNRYNTNFHFMKEFQENTFPAVTDKTRSIFYMGRPLEGYAFIVLRNAVCDCLGMWLVDSTQTGCLDSLLWTIGGNNRRQRFGTS